MPYGWTMPAAPTNGCLNTLASTAYASTSTMYNNGNSRKLIASMWNSDSFDTVTPVYYSSTTADVCTTNATCASSTQASYITDAQNGSSTIAIGYKVPGNTGYTRAYHSNGGSTNSYLSITYSGGIDTDASSSISFLTTTSPPTSKVHEPSSPRCLTSQTSIRLQTTNLRSITHSTTVRSRA